MKKKNLKDDEDFNNKIGVFFIYVRWSMASCYSQDCPFRRGAEITATKKDKRRELFSIYLDANRDEIDTTYTVVKKLSERALGRSFNRKYILDAYARSGRTAETKSENIDNIEEIYQIYFKKNGFEEDLRYLEDLMNNIIAEHKANK
ncbi:hypothetical protein [Halomonas sp. DWK9]|uniref:hypothetical protein n=1 Tax=Halomonas sp. DWK9 TaxID=3060155 RepID=UPI00287FB405|nr:hypothetical protein [Halomonas sp. DWK9]